MMYDSNTTHFHRLPDPPGADHQLCRQFPLHHRCFLLPILHVHHQLLLLSQDDSAPSRIPLISSVPEASSCSVLTPELYLKSSTCQQAKHLIVPCLSHLEGHFLYTEDTELQKSSLHQQTFWEFLNDRCPSIPKISPQEHESLKAA